MAFRNIGGDVPSNGEDGQILTWENGPIWADQGSASVIWGSITGTLANQTDLQTVLNLKAPIASPTFTGTVTVATVVKAPDSTTGTSVSYAGGNGSSGSGGDATLSGGTTVSGSFGGNAIVQGANNVISGGRGGAAQLLSGNSNRTSSGSPTTVSGGSNSGTGDGGSVTISGGTATGNGAGGDVIVKGGQSTTAGAGGALRLRGGLTSTGVAGPIIFSVGGVASGTERGRFGATGNFGIGTTTPAASAIFDLTSTTQGALMPRMTTTQRDAISSPATGLIIFNTTNVQTELYDGTRWSGWNGTYLPVSSNITGTYGAGLTVVGTATVTGNLTVNGNLIVVGGLTCTGGFSMTVNGNVVVTGSLNFTPASTATPQSSISVKGNLVLGATSQFKVNPGQSPSMTIGGDWIINSSTASFDGSGQGGAGALGIVVHGNARTNDLTLNGGAAISTADGGNGGTIAVDGELLAIGSLQASGGNSAQSARPAGSGGSITASKFLGFATLNGGTASGSATTGGNAGTLTASEALGTVTANGGDANGSNAGSAGSIFVSGKFVGTPTLNGGNSTLASGGGNGVFQVGAAEFGGSGFTGNGGNGAVNGGAATQISVTNSLLSAGSIFGNGGTGTTGNGGNGSSVQVFGSVTFYGSDFQFSGGNGGTANGSAGSITAQGGIQDTSDNGITMLDGAGGGTTPTDTCGVFLGGHTAIGTLNIVNRTEAKIAPMAEGAIVLKIGTLTTKKTLNNFTGTATLDVSALTASSMFSYGGTAWYKHTGVAV